jgi:hypothetical protein
MSDMSKLHSVLSFRPRGGLEEDAGWGKKIWMAGKEGKKGKISLLFFLFCYISET